MKPPTWRPVLGERLSPELKCAVKEKGQSLSPLCWWVHVVGRKSVLHPLLGASSSAGQSRGGRPAGSPCPAACAQAGHLPGLCSLWQFRVLFANLVALFWYIYLASLGK